MDLKDFIPLIGVAIGWGLNEVGSKSKRDIEKKKVLGKAISVLIPLLQEMIRVRQAQQFVKSHSKDLKEWDRGRLRSYEVHTNNDPEYKKKIDSIIDSLGEYFPIESQQLREAFTSYQWIKTKDLSVFIRDEDAYIPILSTYETAHLTYQYVIEKSLYFYCFNFGYIQWAKFRYSIYKQRRRPECQDMIFLTLKRKRFWQRKKDGKQASIHEIVKELSSNSLSDEDKTL